MTVALIGGIDRLERHYKNAAKDQQICVKIYNKKLPKLEKRLKSVDGIILFTAEVSHCATRCVRKVAEGYKIPVVSSNTSGLTAFEKSIRKLKREKSGVLRTRNVPSSIGMIRGVEISSEKRRRSKSSRTGRQARG